MFKFEDDSSLKVIIGQGGVMNITLQARHLGTEIKTTSATIKLKSDEVVELINWIGEELVKEFPNV
jgi:hypothetical protein